MNTAADWDGQNRNPLIMVVDDNPEFLSGMELTLQMEGFDVITSVNGQEALDDLYKVFRAQVEDDSMVARLPDLILADIMMPEMDGYQFYDHVRNNPHLHHIPFIFLTAKSSNDDIRLGKELGSDDYLSKPCLPEDVLATIKGKLKRVEQQRFFDLMTKRAEERKQTLSTPSNPDSPVDNRMVVLAAIAVIIVTVIFVLFLFPQ